jgi:hypothetical protein
MVGLVLPIIPSACLFLAAAWAFGRSSPRLERALLNNRLVGAHLRRWQSERTVSPRIKYGSLALLWTTLALSAVMARSSPWVLGIHLVVGAAITWHLSSIRTTGSGAGPVSGCLKNVLSRTDTPSCPVQSDPGGYPEASPGEA